MATYKRSELNKWKGEYADTVNGVVLSVYDVMEADNLFEGATIIEDE